MINYIAAVKMGTIKSFIHLIKCFKGKKLERCLIIPIYFLAVLNFSLRCFAKDKFDSSMRPKCFCSSTFATTVPLKIICGWF